MSEKRKFVGHTPTSRESNTRALLNRQFRSEKHFGSLGWMKQMPTRREGMEPSSGPSIRIPVLKESTARTARLMEKG